MGTFSTMEIGNRIARARMLAGMTQTDLAKAVGVSRGLVGQWESHAKKPGRENLKKIADVTLVNVASLLNADVDPNAGVVVTDPEALKMLRAFLRMSVRQRKNAVELFGISADVSREVEQETRPAKTKQSVG